MSWAIDVHDYGRALDAIVNTNNIKKKKRDDDEVTSRIIIIIKNLTRSVCIIII